MSGLRPLNEIAAQALADPNLKSIARTWSEPYLKALLSCRTIKDSYGEDGADTLVHYALSNLKSGHYRGEVAKLIKAELAAHVKR